MRFLFLLFVIPVCHAGVRATDERLALPSAPKAYVTDNAQVVAPDAIQRLNGRLVGHEKESTDQIVVCIERRLPEGAELATYSKELFNQWGIGQKGKNNGVLILVFTEDRKVRITVGKGVESVLPDDECQRIITECMAPLFRIGDYGGGIDKSISAIVADLNARLL